MIWPAAAAAAVLGKRRDQLGAGGLGVDPGVGLVPELLRVKPAVVVGELLGLEAPFWGPQSHVTGRM